MMSTANAVQHPRALTIWAAERLDALLTLRAAKRVCHDNAKRLALLASYLAVPDRPGSCWSWDGSASCMLKQIVMSNCSRSCPSPRPPIPENRIQHPCESNFVALNFRSAAAGSNSPGPSYDNAVRRLEDYRAQLDCNEVFL